MKKSLAMKVQIKDNKPEPDVTKNNFKENRPNNGNKNYQNKISKDNRRRYKNLT